ncbi:MAG: hypothetical protein AAF798_02785 [Bacteroidota bacterium]
MYKSILLLLCLSAISCQNTSAPQEAPSVPSDIRTRFQDFADFYKAFHADSLYQVEHVNFPLEGLPAEADSATIMQSTFRWQKADWTMHRGFNVEGSEFQQDFLPLGDDLIIEKFVHPQSGWGIIRRFAKLDGEWYLIYYTGLNKIQ